MEKLRSELDVIDKQIRELFEKRLDLVSKVAQYKLDNNLDVLDRKREESIIKNRVCELNNSDYTNYYVQFLENQFEISRSLQEKLIKNTDK